MKFIDEAKIEVWAGDGGNGCCGFRREKYVPRGGPNGGDGGRGGHVIVRADEGLTTLMDIRYRRHARAGRGGHGLGKQMDGRSGEDVIINLPVGTVVYDDTTGAVIVDLNVKGAEHVVAKGGGGGLGNTHFATPTHQTPERADPGEPGEHRFLRLELKLLADVGLLGFPNAGKSTFISVVSKARPKIADYPFTTLVPNLGVVQLGISRTFTVADIPGLIEGAHLGVGLGVKFLRHIERTRALLHLIDISDTTHYADPETAYRTLRNELSQYNKDLLNRPEIVVFTKCDVSEIRELALEWTAKFNDFGCEVRMISAATGEGIKPLLEDIWKLL